ncbi:tRNA threonylcarbamoyladenosine dehydratase [Hydrogenophaga taeniospiralis]|jgi:tRNA threonylcarbamoyladenosine dehydratase|uniref:tRNA threonylcarbamoyladenosine dehydratase n=1 Tax=Hydrogenophaga taeniospiralis TaxID=65656 RepID=UPI001CFBD548|nr:tRNA threonylcarbamoyladenosine dehydratase [Hydrogenophaga taeniospiralis]MCB4365205.1 tRNA threonylcarbamoyladenosine dehydratase [Hydrogenophaga taeniospiralis]
MSIDFERRFGGLRRLYGMEGSQRIFDAHVVVVGIGGVGSWAVEALARSGVRRLTLIDMDHVSESNINRQIHALDATLGQSKVLAMRERIAQFHPACVVDVIDDFVTPENWPQALEALGVEADAGGLGLIDACDQVRAKTALAAWALNQHVPLVTVGAAGGKRQAHAVDMADLADTTHDPLLAQLRYRLRKHHGAARTGRIGVNCVFSRETVAAPDASCQLDAGDGSLNCHGYGSAVSVTATFGLCAAGALMNVLANNAHKIPLGLQKDPKMTL